MHLPNESQIFIGSNLGDEIEITEITNAKEPVMTAKETPEVKKGDYILVKYATWGKLMNQQLRVKEVADKSITVEGIDTSDQLQFPEGATATIVKIGAWTEIPCVQELTQDGGEQQYYNYQCLSDAREKQIATYKSAVSITYTFAHEYDNPIYPLLRGFDASKDIAAVRMYVPQAAEMRMFAGTISFNDIPKTAMNEMETVSITLSLLSNFVSVPATQA